jgi:hypothetical protein
MGLVDHLESVSQISFKNAIRMIEEDFPLPADQPEEARLNTCENLAQFSKRLHQFSQYNK